MQCRLGRIVDTAKHVRHDACQTPDLHDRALGLHDQRRKRLAHAHHPKHIRAERLLHLVEVDICRRNSVIASSIIYEEVELAVCDARYILDELLDRGSGVDVDGEEGDAAGPEVGDLVLRARSRNDL